LSFEVERMAKLTDTLFYELVAAQRDLIKFVGGIARAAEITSMSKSEAGRWNTVDLMTMPMVALLEADCRQAPVTAVMARVTGRRLSDPDAQACAGAGLPSNYADTARKAAELMARGALALADGRVTVAEAVDMDRAASDLIAAAGELRRAAAGVRAAGLAIVGGAA